MPCSIRVKNEGQNAQDINVGTNNRSSDSDVRFDNGDGFGLSTSYDFGMGISAAAAYTSSDRTNDQMTQTNARGDKAEALDRRPEVRRQRYLPGDHVLRNPQYDPVRQ